MFCKVPLRLRVSSTRWTPKSISIPTKIIYRRSLCTVTPKMRILVGSQTGTAMGFAHELQHEAADHNIEADVVDMNDYDVKDLEDRKKQFLVFVTACYGAGQPTDNAKKLFNYIMSQQPSADSPFTCVNYSVFGLGKSVTYSDRYQAVGRALDSKLAQLGANRVFKKGEGDDDGNIEEDFTKWKEEFWQTVSLNPNPSEKPASEAREPKKSSVIILENPVTEDEQQLISKAKGTMKNPAFIPIAEHKELHTKISPKSCKHIEFDITNTELSFQTGDHLGIWPSNDPAIVSQVAKKLGLDLNRGFKFQEGAAPPFPVTPDLPVPCSVGTALTRYCDINAILKKPILELCMQYAQDCDERAHLASMCENTEQGKGDFNDYIVNRQRTLLEVLNDFKSIQIPLDRFMEIMMRYPLQYRYYSISASSLLTPTRISVTADVVQNVTQTGRIHQGTCTHYLSQLKPGDKVPIFVRTSEFRLPEDPATPVILAGAGSGLAPLYAFVQERKFQRQQGLKVGRTLLFFGCYHQNKDFLYQEELEDLNKRGIIELSTAFSHDQPQRIFVQHRMMEKAADIWRLLQSGAHVYVCGNAKTLGPGVHSTLCQIAAKEGNMTTLNAEGYIKSLRSSARYQDDVF